MAIKKSKDFLGSSLEKEILGTEMTFGMALEALRVRDELTQANFAKKLGVSRQYLCDLEKGRRLVSLSQAARIAKAFGHSPEVLVQLAIQDEIRDSKLNLKVEVKSAA